MVKRLSIIDNIVGIKDSSGDMTLTSQYIRETGDSFSVLAGRDTLILGTLFYGGKGAIAATANVAPNLVVEIYRAWQRGDMEKGRIAQSKLAPLRMTFGLGTFPVVIKEALKLIGIDVGPARAPVQHLAKDKKGELRRILRQMGLLEK